MEYLLEKVDFKDKKSGETKGKAWSFIPVGIRINGKWYNGAIFDEKLLETLKEGQKVDLVLYQEEYKEKMYDKFKFPTESDKQNSRIERLEKGLKTLYDSPKIAELINL